VIKTGGEWISSLEIEDILSQHAGVTEAAVIGVRDERWGERPMALVVLAADAAGTIAEDDLKAHVRSYADRGLLSKWAVPDRVRFVEAIDRTSVGKVDKKALRLKYGQESRVGAGGPR
jgi:fatty-acyl-CoA synthase